MHVIYSLNLTFDGLLRLVAWSNLGPVFYPVIHNYVFFHLLCNLFVRKFILQYKKRLKYEFFFNLYKFVLHVCVVKMNCPSPKNLVNYLYIHPPPQKKTNQIYRSCSCVMHCMCMSLVYKSNFLKDVRKLNEHINIS